MILTIVSFQMFISDTNRANHLTSPFSFLLLSLFLELRSELCFFLHPYLSALIKYKLRRAFIIKHIASIFPKKCSHLLSIRAKCKPSNNFVIISRCFNTLPALNHFKKGALCSVSNKSLLALRIFSKMSCCIMYNSPCPFSLIRNICG